LIPYLILFIVLLCLLMILLKIQVEIKVIIKNGQNFSFVIFRLLRLIRLRMNLSINQDGKGLISLSLRRTELDKEKKASVEQVWNYIKKLLNFYTSNIDQINFMKSKVKINNLYIRTRIGTGDASATALSVGGFYAFFSFLIRHLDEYYHFQKCKLDVLPYFQGSLFDLNLDCIINFKIGNIIITGLKMLTKKVKAV
jgi:hypothetical protein